MSAHFVAVGDTRVRVPEGAYAGRLYRPADPPEDFKIEFDFDIPAGVRVDHRAPLVVAFMIDPTGGADMRYKVLLNGVELLSPHTVGGVARGMWEVVRSDLLRDLPDRNRIEFWALPDLDSSGHLYFSDIVVWFNAA